MEELIAKKYIKAMKNSLDNESMKNVAHIFEVLATFFKDAKFINIINNPSVSSEDKRDILLDSVKSIKSDAVNNLIQLLVEKNRLNVIPALAEELRKDIANETKNYTGIVYSDTQIDEKTMQDLNNGLSKKFDSKIELIFKQSNFDGIKVDVEDLGVEIDFSKSRINEQILEHIIKAI